MNLASVYGPLGIGLDYLRYVPASKMDQATPPLLDPKAPHNIGDWFVTKIVDRLLDYDELTMFTREAAQQEFDYINRACDALVLKGGNYLQSGWLSKTFGLQFFEKIEIPIVIFGVGLQASFGEEVAFEAEEVEILKYIHESCAYSCVRGNRTSEALERIGITNAIVTGCPTVFWSRKPRLEVRQPNDRSAGFSYRQWLFTPDPTAYEAQFQAIEAVRRKFGSVTVILQGEEVALQHYLQARRWGAEYRWRITPVDGVNLRSLKREPLDPGDLGREIHARLDQFGDPAFVDWLMNNSFFSYDMAEYIREYRSKGMMIGCRLHSNLVALANETPTFYLTYDERTQEIVDLFDIPGCRLVDFGPDVPLLEQDWRPFERKYEHYYREMLRFLDTNGLKHRLPAPELAAA